MSFIIGILTVLIVLNCVLLIFLVLVQLPKKDAGAGLAFGGGAADALFGAGSGNALTKITKWAAGIFMVMAVILGLMESKFYRGDTSAFEKAVQQKQQQSQSITPASAQSPPPSTTPATGNGLLPLTTALPATNPSAAGTTNPAK
jgi:preprotein translocase subunit SecG